jgi:hypothetical protein
MLVKVQDVEPARIEDRLVWGIAEDRVILLPGRRARGG